MKKFLSFLSVLFIITLSLQPVSATTEVPSLYSEYTYLYDPQTKVVYIDQKADEKIYPASMTKVLTVSVALEKIKDLSEKVTMVKKDFDGLEAAGATVARLNPGEKVTYKDLIYGALLPSGADACNALARTLFGNYQGMVDAMNVKIAELKLTQTHFTNVTGLHDDNHYTTSKEMGLILEDALKNKDFVEAFDARSYQDSLKKRTWTSTLSRAESQKKLDVSHLDGAKSGFTDKAQLTLACTMTIDSQQLILITAKADGQKTQNHVRDALSIYEYMNDHYQQFVLYKKGETIHHYWVLKSFHGIYSLNAKNDIVVLIEKNISKDDVNIKYDGKTIINAPIVKGENTGSLKLTVGDQTLYQYELLSDQVIDSSIFAIMIHYLLIIIIPLLIIYIIIKKIKSKH